MKCEAKKRVLIFSSVFLLSLCICFLITGIYIQTRSKLEHTEMEQLAINKSTKVCSVLTDLLYKTQILAAFVEQNNGNADNFESFASIIVDDPCIRNVILAPNGVVTHVYPFAGNESVIGLDYFSDSEGNKEAILARDTGELVLGGPFNLIQGGQAIVGRLPIQLENESGSFFWGIASITLHYPQALEAADLDQLQSRGYAYELWRINPDNGEHQIIANSDYEYAPNAKYVEYEIHVLNADWYFRLSPIRHWWQFPEFWLCVIISLFISVFAGFIVLKNHDLNLIKLNLEKINQRDSLTGIYNRSGIFQILSEMIAHKKSFILAYMDLNNFKSINDSYGHTYGDRVLQHFSKTLSAMINENTHIFARIGGDEFILVFKNEEDIASAEAFFHQFNEYLAEGNPPNETEKIQISYSFGLSCYPKDGSTIDRLIYVADMKMYTDKRERLSTE